MSTKQELERIKQVTGCNSLEELLDSLEGIKEEFIIRDFGYTLDEEYNLIDAIYNCLENYKFNQDITEYNLRHVD